MKQMLFVTIIVTSIFAKDQFKSLWYDGKSEISSYRLIEKRYGEFREGMRVMVVVTEPMDLRTHIKPDNKIPEKNKIRVIKLNDIRNFTTGIYDYSVMTSVFAAVENKNEIPQTATMKVSFSAQEWCGMVFERLVRNDSTYNGNLYSYFESDGEKTYSYPHRNGSVETEDNLWLIIRELHGPILKPGESMTVKVIPSMWSRRKKHTAIQITDATIMKGRKQTKVTNIGKLDAIPFTWEIEGAKTEVWVEHAYPHRILSWTEPDGTNGTIIASQREPYWKQHSNGHLTIRKKFELPTEHIAKKTAATLENEVSNE